MVAWAEIPLVNDVTDSRPSPTTPSSSSSELIRQNYNHPSVVFWGLCNELTQRRPATNALMTALKALAHAEDPTRLSTTLAVRTSGDGDPLTTTPT